jgi:hypothetical protein
MGKWQGAEGESAVVKDALQGWGEMRIAGGGG